MKNFLNKIKDGIFIGIGFFLVFGLVNAWSNLPEVSSGEPLTATIWNDLVTQVNETGNRVAGIFTDGSNNVGIGTATPTQKLSVDGVIESLTGGIKFPDGTTQLTATIGTTDTNAGTICSVGEYLDGDGTCKTERYNSAFDSEIEIDAAISNNGYLTGGSISDTNAGTICSVGEYLDGDGTCKTERYNSAYDTELEIDTAIANNGYISSFTELDPQVGSNTTNYISKWNGTSLGTSTIFDNGNIGIGTGTPGQKLDVVGAIKSDYIIVNSQDGVNEGGELRLDGAGVYSHIQVDNYLGNIRIHTLESGKIFDILGGNGLRANGADMNSNKIVNVTNPTSAQDVATKDYVDSAVSGAGGSMTLYYGSGCGGCPYGSFLSGAYYYYCKVKNQGGSIISTTGFGFCRNTVLATNQNRAWAMWSY